MATPPNISCSLRILLITTEYPSPARPGGGAYLVRHVAALERKGHTVSVLHFASRANPLNHFRAWQRMRKELRDGHYDLVHAHFGHAAVIARLQRYAPMIVTYHGSDVLGIYGPDGRYSWKGKLGSAISKLMSLTAEDVIVVADHIGHRLPRRDWTVVPLGVDIEQFQLVNKEDARAQLGWSRDRFLVLFAALNANNPVKRLPLAREAMHRLATELPTAELKIAEGLPPQAIPLMMCAADALLLTSAHEGSPTVVKEAMAANLPVVSTDVGDVRERLKGVTPGAVAPDDPESLAVALLSVACSGQRSNGRDVIIRDLSEAEVADRVVQVYRTVLQRWQGARVERS